MGRSGLVWGGAEYNYSSSEFKNFRSNFTERNYNLSSHNLQFSFGIEKQMIWDWFMIRVGATKVFAFQKLDQEDEDGQMQTIQRSFSENEEGDVVGFGIALVANEALRFDVTASEEMPYSNLLSDQRNGMLISRVSASYKF